MMLCVLLLQIQRAAEIRCERTWTDLTHVLGGLKAVRYRTEKRRIVQRTEVRRELCQTLPQLRFSRPRRCSATSRTRKL